MVAVWALKPQLKFAKARNSRKDEFFHFEYMVFISGFTIAVINFVVHYEERA